MSQTIETPPYALEPDEKTVMVVVHTPGILLGGEVVVKKLIRVSTWLRTNNAPDYIRLYRVRTLVTAPGAAAKPVHYKELHVGFHQIQAFHMLPPAQDPPDYDTTEPNRHMVPVSVLLGGFRIDGHLRLSTQSNLAKYLETAREVFTPMYDAQIQNPQIPSVGVMRVPYLIVRRESSLFSIP
jgi:hypothetical protein